MKNILIVEDQRLSQTILAARCKKLGFNTVIVNNGLEALNKIKGGSTYYIIFMDCSMPIMGGLEATKRIREYEHFNNLQPQIIFANTTDDSNENKSNCSIAGMNDFLVKGHSTEDIENLCIKHNLKYLNSDNEKQ